MWDTSWLSDIRNTFEGKSKVVVETAQGFSEDQSLDASKDDGAQKIFDSSGAPDGNTLDQWSQTYKLSNLEKLSNL